MTQELQRWRKSYMQGRLPDGITCELPAVPCCGSRQYQLLQLLPLT
jgi:hypothetical protein